MSSNPYMAKLKGKRRRVVRKPKAKATKKVDKQQNKRIAALERASRAEQGWIDSEYREATMNRIPQLVSRGVQDSASPDPEFFVMAQGTDGSDKDHKRIGLSINAKKIHARIRLTGRGNAAGYPPDSGVRSGKNQVRLLGVCYETLADFTIGLTEVLQNSVDSVSNPSRLLDTYYKKQSTTKWHIWYDNVCTVPFTTQTKVVNINYNIPKKYQKMVYALDTVTAPDTNIFVLYAMTGIRDNAQNQTTLQATYRMTYDK
ncbi:MAG: hypothetical protein [Circular genetic element sp.]|nr:MAG: hypothetical protein [Circular genetic element sp.]